MSEITETSIYADLLDSYLVNEDLPSKITTQQFNNHSFFYDNDMDRYPEIMDIVNAASVRSRYTSNFQEQFDLVSSNLKKIFDISGRDSNLKFDDVSDDKDINEIAILHEMNGKVENETINQEIGIMKDETNQISIDNDDMPMQRINLPTKEESQMNKQDLSSKAERSESSASKGEDLLVESKEIIPPPQFHIRTTKIHLKAPEKVKPPEKLPLSTLLKRPENKKKRVSKDREEHKISFDLDYDSNDSIDKRHESHKSKSLQKSRSANVKLVSPQEIIEEDFYEEEDCSGDEIKYGGILAFAKNLGIDLDNVPSEQNTEEALEIINSSIESYDEELSSQYNSKQTVISETDKLTHKIKKTLDEGHHIRNAIVVITINNALDDTFSKYIFKKDIKIDKTFFNGYNLSPFRQPPNNRRLYCKWLKKMLKRDKLGIGEDDVDHEFLPQKNGKDVSLSLKEMDSFRWVSRIVWHQGRKRLRQIKNNE